MILGRFWILANRGGPRVDSTQSDATVARGASVRARYVGVTGLAAIVRDHPKYAQEHQMAVIDCLEDPDETLKRKTLDLLYTMTNPVNVEFIADKLLSFLEQGNDSFWRRVSAGAWASVLGLRLPPPGSNGCLGR